MSGIKSKTKLINFDDIYDKFPSDDKVAIEVGVIRLDLANKIRQARKLKHLSSQQLAELSGVSYKTISKMENAKPVNFDTVVRVLEPLDLKVTYSLK